jgi:hypothetical protein
MIDIDKFSFCFFSSDINDVIRQEIEITKLSNKFQIERHYRHERNSGMYLSFSQMVNDAIDDTDSEFMIFCNPKTIPTVNDIEFIIEKLSTGYCFASAVSFGLFGFSKELIRQIGMLDERFIGGGFEDNDFAIRLLEFGKASWWGYNTINYLPIYSKSNNLKHISTSIFNQKYNIDEEMKEIIINSHFFNHKKISKRHQENNPSIFEGWLDNNSNYGDGIFGDYLMNYKIKYNDKVKVQELVEFSLNITKNNTHLVFELNSHNNLHLIITIVKSLEFDRTILSEFKLKNNFFFSVDSTEFLINENYVDPIEIRVFLDDNQIYTNTLSEFDDIKLKYKLPMWVDIKN